MTDKETMKLALEALELVNLEFVCNGAHHAKKDRHEHDEACPVTMRYLYAIAALAERLKNPKKWVGLTDDEVEHLRNDQPWWAVRDIEAKLKEKNGG